MSDNVASAPTAGFPTVEEINGWDRDRVKRFLQAKSTELELEVNDIDIIYSKKVSGKAFLRLTEEQLTRVPGTFQLDYTPASAIAELVKQIKGDQPVAVNMGPPGRIHIFVDNSNLYIQGMVNVGRLENICNAINNNGVQYFKDLRIDYGRLLRLIINDRQVGNMPYLVGSRPPSYDSLWKYVEMEGFEVETFDRDRQNHEKEVDSEIACAITETSLLNEPGTISLISGDKDMRPGVKRALNEKWNIEIWFWPKGIPSSNSEPTSNFNGFTQKLLFAGIASELKKKATFIHLGYHYKYFTYGYGSDVTNRMRFFDITNGNVFDNNDVLDWFARINLFCWMSRRGNNLRLYFKNDNDLSKAKEWIRTQQNNVQFRR